MVIVTDRDVLVSPTPVVGNRIDPGCALTDAAAPPIPTSEAIAASGKLTELAESVPLTTPLVVGVKSTPTEQLAPAARLVPQVLPVRPNGAAAATANCNADRSPVFVIVAVCAALASPSLVCTKFN